jgi:hypothetical protein
MCSSLSNLIAGGSFGRNPAACTNWRAKGCSALVVKYAEHWQRTRTCGRSPMRSSSASIIRDLDAFQLVDTNVFVGEKTTDEPLRGGADHQGIGGG